MTDEPDKAKPDQPPDKPKKNPKPRRTGQRETLVAGKKYVLRVFLGKEAAGKRHYHSETFHGTAGQAHHGNPAYGRRDKSEGRSGTHGTLEDYNHAAAIHPCKSRHAGRRE